MSNDSPNNISEAKPQGINSLNSLSESKIHLSNDQHLLAVDPYRRHHGATITTRVNGIKIPVLYDTGAIPSCISEECFNRYFTKVRTTGPTGQTFAAAGEGILSSKGTIILTINLKGKSLKEEFHIIPNLGRPMIFGLMGMDRHNIVIDPRGKEIVLRGSKTAIHVPFDNKLSGTPRIMNVYPTTSLDLDPYTETYLEARLSKADTQRFRKKGFLYSDDTQFGRNG
jgi:hypothetical protein